MATLLPTSSEELAASIRAIGVSLPLSSCPKFKGSIVDADGREVLVVEPNNERFTDRDADALAHLFAIAINVAAEA